MVSAREPRARENTRITRKRERGRGEQWLACRDIPRVLLDRLPSDPSYLSLADEPIAQLVTGTNSLFRLSLFPTFRWSPREMAERVLTLGRKAEVDKRQSRIEEAAPGEKLRKGEFAGHEKGKKKERERERGRERGRERERENGMSEERTAGKCARERKRFHRETFSREWNVRSV